MNLYSSLNELNNLSLSPNHPIDAFANTDFPVVICSPDWKIIYRNESSYRELAHFRMSSGAARLAPAGVLKKISESRKATFVSFPGESMKRALVTPFRRSGQFCYVIAFISWAQLGAIAPLTAELESNMLSLINTLPGELTDIDTQFVSTHRKYANTIDPRVREVSMRNLSLYLIPSRPRVYDSDKSIRDFFSLMAYFTADVFRRSGYSVEIEMGRDLNPSGYYISSFNSFCAVCFDIVFCALDTSSDRSARIFISLMNYQPTISIFFKSDGKDEISAPINTKQFATLFPSHRISALICAELALSIGGCIGAYINTDKNGSNEIEIRLAPKCVPPKDVVRAQSERPFDLMLDFLNFIRSGG